MTLAVLVWDLETDPPTDATGVLFWRKFTCRAGDGSIPDYLERHADQLKSKYLAFVHDLGETRVSGKRIVEHMDLGDGFSFWWANQVTEKGPFKSPGIYDCLRLLALEDILVERAPSRLQLASSDDRLTRAVARLCDSLSIQFAPRGGRQHSSAPWTERLYYRLPYMLQGALSLRHVLRRWTLRGLGVPMWFGGKNAVFVCSYFIHLDGDACAAGRYHSRQWEVLPKMLHAAGRRTNWIQHFLFSALVPDTQTGLAWLRRFNLDEEGQGQHVFLDTFLSPTIVLAALVTWVRLNVVAWRMRDVRNAFHAPGSLAWLWPFLEHDWQTSLKGPIALGNCLWLALFDAAFKSMPRQRLGIYLCENQGWEKAMLYAWRKHGHGEIIGVQHATVPYWHLNYFDDPRVFLSSDAHAMPRPDQIAVNGMSAWKALAEAGYPEEELVKVEALRYLNLRATAERRRREFAEQAHVCTGVDDNSKVRVLVLGELNAGSMTRFLSSLESAALRLPPHFRFTFKPHPGLSVDLAQYPGLRADETTEALDRILDRFDVAVSANSTSAALDAYVAGLAVVIILDGSYLNLNPLRGQAGVRFASTPENFADAIVSAGAHGTDESTQNEYFFLDPELPRWRQLLGLEAVNDP